MFREFYIIRNFYERLSRNLGVKFSTSCTIRSITHILYCMFKSINSVTVLELEDFANMIFEKSREYVPYTDLHLSHI